MQSTLGLLTSADDRAVDLCVVYMMATYSKYILHKSSKPATYIWVRLIIGCVQYTLKYGNQITTINFVCNILTEVMFQQINSVCSCVQQSFKYAFYFQ